MERAYIRHETLLSKVTIRNMATAQFFYLLVVIGNVNKISEITTGGFLRSKCNRSKTAY